MLPGLIALLPLLHRKIRTIPITNKMDFRFDFLYDRTDYSGAGNTFPSNDAESYTYNAGSVFMYYGPYYAFITTNIALNSTEDFIFETELKRHYSASTARDLCLIGDLIVLNSSSTSVVTINGSENIPFATNAIIAIKITRESGVLHLFINDVEKTMPTTPVSFSVGWQWRLGFLNYSGLYASYNYIKFSKA